MHVLWITDEFPWPARTGYRLRLAQIGRGLVRAGSVDLVAVVADDAEHVAPPETGLGRIRIVRLPPARSSPVGYARWASTGLPRTIAARDWAPVRARISAIAAESNPDVVWWSHADVYSRTHDVVAVPAIVDLVDLEDLKLQQRRWSRRDDRVRANRRPSVAERIRATLDREDERRWRSLQRRIAAKSAALVVCSELDRSRLGSNHAVVVPNGYDAPATLPARRHEGATLTMIALFTYEPNLDAAIFLVQRVLPRIRADCPDAQVRLVGRHDCVLDALAGPGVVITGEVPDVAAALARSDVVVVPLRFGGGTRLKVLEAFAHRVPVVSTTLGAEGLGAKDGVELVLADDEKTFARACISLIEDRTRAHRLADAAHRLWSEQFSGERVAGRVADLVRAVGDTSNAPLRGSRG